MLCGQLVAGTVLAEEKLGPGATIAELRAGQKIYRQVIIKTVGARTITVLHEGGMASIALRDLPENLQQDFGYSAETEAAAELKIKEAQALGAAQREKDRAVILASPLAKERGRVENRSKYARVLQGFGQMPELVEGGVDLRPKFREFELGAKSQGLRPSCSVFAVVSALEFQNAEMQGRAEKLSEEYVIWATGKVLGRTLEGEVDDGREVGEETRDAGYSLSEVAGAIRAYGVPLQAAMPNKRTRLVRQMEEPAADVIEEARKRQQVYVHIIPGEGGVAQVRNMVVALNEGIPVVIGVAWPHYLTVQRGVLDAQKPAKGSGHAVTLVGYETATGRLEDAFFWFKNSYGVRWGMAGYGKVSYRYLTRNLMGGAMLEVQVRE